MRVCQKHKQLSSKWLGTCHAAMRVRTVEGMMNIINEVMTELEKATAKFPTWPTDPLHALAVLSEEKGELDKAVLQMTYEPHKSSLEEVRMEAIQTAAMALRFAMSLDAYVYKGCEQHKQ